MRPPDRIETDRLTLRPLVVADAAAVFAYASDEATTRYMDFTRHQRLAESEEFAQRCERSWKDGTGFPWAIVERTTGEFIGCIELRIAEPNGDFGYILDRRAWGQGYATEAALAVMSWARAQPTIFRVWATCHPANAASARVLQKAGLTYETRLESRASRPDVGEPAGESLRFAWTRPIE